MSLVHPGNLSVLSGPYGTVLAEQGFEKGIPDLGNPLKVVGDGPYRAANLAVARAYAEHVDIMATNTFAARTALRMGDRDLYREAVQAHHALVAEAVEAVRRRLKLVIAIGPYGDCYQPDEAPDTESARDFHGAQFGVARELSGVNAVLAETLCTKREAIGVALAARDYKVKVIISFVVDATGRLLSGESPEDAIKEVDAATDGHPLGYSYNCCPIVGADKALAAANGQGSRVILLYPNASDLDPRQLDGETEGTGVVQRIASPRVRADQLAEIAARYPDVSIIGGCCGFDNVSVRAIGERVRREFM